MKITFVFIAILFLFVYGAALLGIIYFVKFLTLDCKDKKEILSKVMTIFFKKRILALITLLIVLGISAFYLNSRYDKTYNELIHSVPDPNDRYTFIIEFEGLELVEPNSVGWSYEHRIKVANKEIKTPEDYKIILTGKYIDTTVSFQIQATEYDSIPDVGYLDSEKDIGTLLKDKEFIWNVYVRENRGRYSGNVALIEYRFSFQREVEPTEVFKAMFK